MNNPGGFKTFTAGGDIAAKRIVTVAADHVAAQATAPAAANLGVTELPYKDGESVDIATEGIVEVEAGSAITHGHYVTADADGRAVMAALNEAAFGVALGDAVAGEYVPVRINQQRAALGDNSVLRLRTAEDREYNSEWIPRMTGTGTELDPYLIYTPCDFNDIRLHLSANYVLMNNLDFSDAIGVEISLEDGGLVYGANNDDAPLYNESQGWEPITEFTGVLNGNGKTLRGLSCCRDQENVGLFAVLGNAKVSNLTIKDSVFVNPRQSGALGAVAGKMNERSFIENCVSYATVYSSNVVGELFIGGLIGRTYGQNYIKNCANHGRLESLSDKAYIGGIIGPDSRDCFVSGCYNTANIYAKKTGGIAVDSEYCNNCYNVGAMTGWDASSDITCRDVSTPHCYSLAGCATNMQGTPLLANQLKAEAAVDLLNEGLPVPVFVAAENDYPKLDFEALDAQSISPNLQLAVIDVSSGEALPSKITLRDFMHQPSRRLYSDLRSEVDGKSKVSKVALTLSSSGWDNGAQTASATGVNANSVLVLIPKSADAFTYGLSIDSQGSGTVTIACTDTPADSVSVDLLVIN